MNPSAIAAASSVTSAEAPWVRRSDESGISTLTLMRPERANPLSRPMIDALGAALAAIAADRSIRVVVLAATGRAFCAGLDLKELGASDRSPLSGSLGAQANPVRAIGQFSGPVIGAINGNTPEQSHESWLKFKEADGWAYGPAGMPPTSGSVEVWDKRDFKMVHELLQREFDDRGAGVGAETRSLTSRLGVSVSRPRPPACRAVRRAGLTSRPGSPCLRKRSRRQGPRVRDGGRA
jgi:hypothetical protein